MHMACGGGHLAICEWLLTVGVKINTLTKMGATCFHMACYHGHLPVCEWLFAMTSAKAGGGVAGLEEKDKEEEGEDAAEEQEPLFSKADNLGMTPMHFACMNGNLRVCLWLYANGAASDMVSRTEGGVF